MTRESTGCDCEFGQYIQYNHSENLFGECSKEELIQQIQNLTTTVNSLLDEKQILQYQLEFHKYIIINCSDNSNETHRLTEVSPVADDSNCSKDLPNNDSVLQELGTDPFPSNVIFDEDEDRETKFAPEDTSIDDNNLLTSSDGLEDPLQLEDLAENDWISRVTVSEADKSDINLNVLAKLNQQVIKFEFETVPLVCEEQVIAISSDKDHSPLPEISNIIPKGKTTTDFCCHLCPNTYKYHFSLKRHLQQQHNISSIIASRKISKKNVEHEPCSKPNDVTSTSNGNNCMNQNVESPVPPHTPPDEAEAKKELNIESRAGDVDNKKKKQKKLLNLVCEECGQIFKYLYNYQRHMKKLHRENQEKYPCSICAKVFPSHKSLRRHQNDVHYTSPEDKHFQCNLCLELFKYHYLLRRHTARVHEFKNRVSCSQCSKTFATDYHLRRHLVLHEKSDPNVVVARKAQGESDTSSTSSVIRKRPRSHGDAFICEYCGKVFPKRNRLVQHCVSHADEKPFSCQLCEKSFTRKAKLIQHQLKRHFDELGGSAKLNGRQEIKGEFKMEVENQCISS